MRIFLYIYLISSYASTFCQPISTLLGLRWIVKGKEYLEKEQACIIVANHQSSLDVLGIFNHNLNPLIY